VEVIPMTRWPAAVRRAAAGRALTQ
jgi:hypothetical protein